VLLLLFCRGAEVYFDDMFVHMAFSCHLDIPEHRVLL